MFDCIVCFLDRWQTLIAGILATVAAAWTIHLLRRQIRDQRKEFKREKKRLKDTATSQNWAARAHLPDALSDICAYAASCYQQVFAENRGNQLPSVPREAIASVKAAIQYADPISAKALYELVVHFQIHNSRLQSRNGRQLEIEFAQMGYDSVVLQCYCNRLFEYGRNEEKVVTKPVLTHEMMVNAHMTIAGLDRFLNHHDELRATINTLIEERHIPTN